MNRLSIHSRNQHETSEGHLHCTFWVFLPVFLVEVLWAETTAMGEGGITTTP